MKRLALCAVAFAAVTSSALAQKTEADPKSLGQEMNAMTLTDWRPGVAFGDKLAALPGETGFEILRDNWNKGASVAARKQMFKGFVFNDHPDTLKVLNLGATDPDVELQNWSFTFLNGIAFIDFQADPGRYPAWFAKYGNRKLDDVRQQNFDRFISDVAASRGEQRELYYRRISHSTVGNHPVHSATALGVVKDIFASPNPTRDAIRAAHELLNVTKPSEKFLRETVLPALHSNSMELREVASSALANDKAEWVDDALGAFLEASVNAPNGMKENGFMLGRAIGEQNNPKSVPLLIGAIAADNTYNSVYGLGYFGLSKLTGVRYDISHDGRWWLNWWENNKSRFPEAVRNTPIPTYK